jgi:ArsR family transcriptional regulator, arsenate/arsenite/antimonite-responsive transcriptional repressor / arsenate reductase (thioredoxin)
MSGELPPAVIRLLAHDLRWQLVRELAVGDYRVNELVARLKLPLNLVSYHLRQLREGELVAVRRSEADRRDAYYSLDLDQLRTAYGAAGSAIHPALAGPGANGAALTHAPSVLFVCTHNSARSQIAEGLMRHMSAGQIAVSSAGSEPAIIHPDAVRTMAALGIDIRAQHAKGFEDVRDQPFDTVITVCDRAREVCPTFPGEAQHIHWGLPDPAAIADEQERQQAFADTAQRLHSRIRHYLTAQHTGDSN